MPQDGREEIANELYIELKKLAFDFKMEIEAGTLGRIRDFILSREQSLRAEQLKVLEAIIGKVISIYPISSLCERDSVKRDALKQVEKIITTAIKQMGRADE
jgi:hypothetical protein